MWNDPNEFSLELLNEIAEKNLIEYLEKNDLTLMEDIAYVFKLIDNNTDECLIEENDIEEFWVELSEVDVNEELSIELFIVDKENKKEDIISIYEF